MSYKNILPALLFAIVLTACGGDEAESEHEDQPQNQENEVVSDQIELDPGIVENLDNGTFKEKMGTTGGVLIDVRSAEEFSEGHIEGAINLDFVSGQLEDSLATLDKEKAVLVYCHAGGRSASARDLLKDNGFMEIYNLENGFSAWEE